MTPSLFGKKGNNLSASYLMYFDFELLLCNTSGHLLLFGCEITALFSFFARLKMSYSFFYISCILHQFLFLRGPPTGITTEAMAILLVTTFWHAMVTDGFDRSTFCTICCSRKLNFAVCFNIMA